MPKEPEYKLISFNICPFVQRSVIVLRHKGRAFEIEYIDLENKPDWFLQKVPTGKVPALFVENDVVFESAIINEFIDETTGAPLLSTDPLTRAKERAWISFADQLIGAQYMMLIAEDRETYLERKESLIEAIQKMANEVQGPYFSGDRFGLVDAATAPLFSRLALTPIVNEEVAERVGIKSPFVQWMTHLLDMDAVRQSVIEDFEQLWTAYFDERGVGSALGRSEL